MAKRLWRVGLYVDGMIYPTVEAETAEEAQAAAMELVAEGDCAEVEGVWPESLQEATGTT